MRIFLLSLSVFLFSACGGETTSPTTANTPDAKAGRVEYYEISKR